MKGGTLSLFYLSSTIYSRVKIYALEIRTFNLKLVVIKVVLFKYQTFFL